MNFESLRLKMEEELILVHNQVTWFTRDSSFMTASLVATIFIFSKEHYTSKVSHFVKHKVGSLDDNQVLMQNIFNIIGWSTEKLR